MPKSCHIFKVSFLIFLLLVSSLTVRSQTIEFPKMSAGAFNSPKGFGLSADFIGPGFSHINSFDVFLDMQGILKGNSSSPGLRVRYNYNLPLLSKAFQKGEELLLYGGPGVTFGYVRDTNNRIGGMCGISGEMNCTYIFNSHFSLTLTLESAVAFHLREDSRVGVLDFKFFLAGAVNTYMPELKIQYCW